MRYLYVLLGFGACLVSAMTGLAVGINFNPESTVRFVLVLDSGAWSALGACFGAIFTAAAVALSLYYSRHDFRERVKLFSESHSAAGPQSLTQMTLRAVCTGRLPTTILYIGFRLKTNNKIFPIAQFTSNYDSTRKLERGDIFEARLDSFELEQIARELSIFVGSDVHKVELAVQTGLTRHSSALSADASTLLKKYLKAAIGENKPRNS